MVNDHPVNYYRFTDRQARDIDRRSRPPVVVSSIGGSALALQAPTRDPARNRHCALSAADEDAKIYRADHGELRRVTPTDVRNVQS
ncbi:hypothetical protein [Jidongwangia harbinensis]|uniref:hypothetical protein n=1 Tax=Jidongwangia harbinensis TaxID=2878561 RepID=UPI001CD95FA2|nr:hypothetical protein [Jidongwangia harbinensis]MCA2217988.1 hypothetical protein [Jidongwangia harbinensis]